MDLDRLKTALAKVAKLVVADPVYLPIFTRLEAEIAKAEANDPLARARALAQSATF